ncbi:MAG: hypothetical protein JWM03_147 [Rhodocyclales bacterium]|nr:hypothetical protein [Rhodocyclales bacterium]
MKGYQLTFFTQQNRRHGHQPLAEWLLGLAKSMPLRSATLTNAQESIGATTTIKMLLSLHPTPAANRLERKPE